MKHMEEKGKKVYLKKLLKVLVVTILVAIFAVTSYLVLRKNSVETAVFNQDSELLRAMNYEQFLDGDSNVEGTDNVKFSAFFLRDLNGDGYAEKIKGTCKEVGTEDTLYMEVIVQTAGYLKDAKIQVDGKNFYFQTALPKDNQIKNNVIGNNVKQIEFNDIPNGTQKMITGVVRSGNYDNSTQKYVALGNNINNYSRNDNNIILTGTYVSENGTETRITKEVKIEMDWYGSTSAEILSYYNGKDYKYQNQDIENVINREKNEIDLIFEIVSAERNNELTLNKSYLEGTVPQLNGYDPISVSLVGDNGTFSYDENTKTFTIIRECIPSKDGMVSGQVFDSTYGSDRVNQYKINIKYPIAAYNEIDRKIIDISIPLKAYYEGFNNPNSEFVNPYKSNIAQSTLYASYTKHEGNVIKFEIHTGKYIGNPFYEYTILKEKPLKIYNGVSTEEKDDVYVVDWQVIIGEKDLSEKIVMKEEKPDEFVKTDSSTISMENITSNVGVGFYNSELLQDNSELKIYDDETNVLLLTVTKNNIYQYTVDKPFRFEFPVKHLRVEITGAKANRYLNVYALKELDDEYITNNYTEEEFDNLQYIKSTLNGYMGDNLVDTTSHSAIYRAPQSYATISLKQNVLSTQETEYNELITIEAEKNLAINRAGWKNADFLIKIPDEIIETEINDVIISNNAVAIISYEYFENEKGKFIKINTNNSTEESVGYSIILDVNITPDPRIVTMSRRFELFASNEEISSYYSAGSDIYDVNGNLNFDEIINNTSAGISFVAPNSLLTNQTISEYDEDGSIVVSPEIADAKIDTRSAKVGVHIKNNYTSTISEVLVLGKIPFEGNTYLLENEPLGSTYTTNIKNNGITIPDEIKDKVTIYYSELENPTKELTNSENKWKRTEEISDWTKIKSFLIDMTSISMESGKEYLYSYEIELPAGLSYNDVSYSHYAIFFCLDTPEGKYRTQTAPNKIGIRIAEKYDLELTKYQINTEKLVQGATYSIQDVETGEIKSAVTNAEGKLLIKNIYAERRYLLKEAKSPLEYALNEEEIEFIGHINENKDLSIEKINGNVRDDFQVITGETLPKACVSVEDEVRASLHITKFEKDTEIRLRGVKYRLSGKGLPDSGKILTTNSNGEITLNGLYIGEEYELVEIKAEGYILNEETIKLRIVNENGIYNIISSGSVKSININNENIPRVNIEVENEKAESFNLEIVKTSKNLNISQENINEVDLSSENINPLSGVVFELYQNNNKVGRYVSDENGKIIINNLYTSDIKKYEYTLREIDTPNDYIPIEDIVFEVYKENDRFALNEKTNMNLDWINSGNTISLVVPNRQVLRLIKQDEENENRLAGVKFSIYKIENEEESPALNTKGEYVGKKEIINNKEYFIVETDSNGEISLNLPTGLYVAREISPKEGYELNDKNYYFGINKKVEKYKSTRAEEVDYFSAEYDDYLGLRECIITSDGDYLYYGVFKGNIEIEGEHFSHTGNSYYNTVVARYSNNGSLKYVKQLNYSIEKLYVLDNNNILYIYGDDNANRMIIKYKDSDFSDIWTKDILLERSYVSVEMVKPIVKDDDIYIVLESYDLAMRIDNYYIPCENLFSDKMVFIKLSELDGSCKALKTILTCSYRKHISINSANLFNGKILVTGYHTTSSSDNTKKEYIYINGESIDFSNNVSGMKIELSLNGDILDYNFYKTNKYMTIQDTICFENSYIISGSFTTKMALNEDVVINSPFEANFQIEKYDIAYIANIDDLGNVLWYRIFDFNLDNSESFGYKMYKINENEFWIAIGRSHEKRFFKINIDNEVLKTYSISDDLGTKNFFSPTEIAYVENDVVYAKDDCYIFKLFEENTISLKEECKIQLEEKDINNISKSQIQDVFVEENGDYVACWTYYGYNGMIIKKDENHNTLWTKCIEGLPWNGKIIGIEGGDYIYVADYSSRVRVDGTALTPITSDSNEIIMRLDSNGNVKWVRNIGAGNLDNGVQNIGIDQNNNIVVSLSARGTSIFGEERYVRSGSQNTGFNVYYDLDGNFKKVSPINLDSNLWIDHINKTPDDKFIVTGYFNQDITINGNLIKNTGKTDVIIIKLDENSNIEYYKTFEGNNTENVRGLISDDTGYTIAIESQSSSLKTEDYTYKHNYYASYYSYLLRFDYNNNLVWEKSYGLDAYTRLKNIIKTNKNEYLLIGDYCCCFDYEGHEMAYTIGVEDNIYLLRLNSEGEFIENAEITSDISLSYNICLFENSRENIVVLSSEYYGKQIYTWEYSVDRAINESEVLTVFNKKKEFKVDTDVEFSENVKGGTISGENEEPYEIVKYGDTNTKEIVMTPNEGYEIVKITINGVEQGFTPNEDGTYTLPRLENITEDKNIVVKFTKSDNKITINKVDSESKERLFGTRFKINEIDERVIEESIIGNLVGNSQGFSGVLDKSQNYNTFLGNLTNNGAYYFTNSSGVYVSNNNAKANTTANSFIPIDLRNVSGNYKIEVNASVFSESNYDWGYATISQSTSAPAYSNSNGRFIYISGTTSGTYTSETIAGGQIYYLHLGYKKDGSVDKNGDNFKINAINLYKLGEENFYNFNDNDGKYESSNQSASNTTSNSYVTIDLRGKRGDFNLIVNAEISSQSGFDYGYATISETVDRVPYNSTTGRFIYISGAQTAADYTTKLAGGKIYYLHLGYYKNGNTDYGEDKFTINDIRLELNQDSLIEKEVDTNISGQAITELPYGKYKITEIEAPEGYVLLSEPVIIEFRQGGTNEFTIENHKKPKLIVHHYIKGSEEKVAEDEEYTGTSGTEYTTKPMLDLADYELEIDENGEYIIPTNAVGTYGEDNIEVIYYYVPKHSSLVVNHFIVGTNTPVLLADGEEAKTEKKNGNEGEEYKTQPIPEESLAEKYELVTEMIPNNADGLFQTEEVVVNYYYRIKKFNITTEVEEYEKTNLLGETELIRGGSISGEDLAPYEKVEYDENSVEDIIIVPDPGYEIKSIKVNDEPIDFAIEPDGKVTLSKFMGVRRNINVAVSFDKDVSQVIVHHYMEGTENKMPSIYGGEVQDEIKRGSIGDPYATKASDEISPRYEVSSIVGETSGTYSSDQIEIIYYYKEVPAKVITNHLVLGTTDPVPLSDGTNAKAITDNGYVTKPYTTVALTNIDSNYVLVKDSGNTEGEMTREDTVVNYYYAPKAKAKVNYIAVNSDDTETVMETIDYEGYDTEEYTSHSKDFSGYTLTDVPEYETAELTKDATTVFNYYYRKNTGLVEKHVDLYTGEIKNTEEHEGIVGTEYQIDRKVFEGYKIATNKKYYEKLVKDNPEILSTNSVKTVEELLDALGLNANDPYIPKNYKGEMKEDTIEVVYYYVKEAKVIVEYHDTNGDDPTKPIHQDDIIPGLEKDPYKTEPIEIDGYDLVTDPEYTPTNAEGEMTEEDIIVKYYYAYKTDVVVNYIDISNESKIDSDKKEGHEKELYKMDGMDLSKHPDYRIVTNKEYYDWYTAKNPSVLTDNEVATVGELLAKLELGALDPYIPANYKGEMTKDEIVVNYYYKKQAKVTVKHIDEATGTVLKTEEAVYDVGDKYATGPETIENYTLNDKKLPGNATGEVKEGGVEVKYYYNKKTTPVTPDPGGNTPTSEPTPQPNPTPNPGPGPAPQSQPTSPAPQSPVVTTAKKIYNKVLPKTGDTTVQTATSIIIMVILLNMIVTDKVNQTTSKTSRIGKHSKKKVQGKRFK